MPTKRQYPAQSYYELLGVPSTATRGEIRAAYLRLVEAARSEGSGSGPRLELVHEAYEVLIDQSSRAAYEAYLSGADSARVAKDERPGAVSTAAGQSASGARRPSNSANDHSRTQPAGPPSWVAPGHPASEALTFILYQIDLALGGTYENNATGIDVVPHQPPRGRDRIYGEFCAHFKVRHSPELVLSRLSDKEYRPPAMSSGIMGAIIARLSPLRFLDGTRYEEFVFATETNPRIAVTERRVPSGQRGELFTAFAVVVTEPTAFISGSPSPSLRAWLRRQQEMLGPTSY